MPTIQLFAASAQEDSWLRGRPAPADIASLNRYAQPATTAMMKVTVSALGTRAEVMGAACMATDLYRANLTG